VEQLLVEMRRLFAGRADVHAKGFFPSHKPDKVQYFLVKDEDTQEPVALSDAVMRSHLLGKYVVGQYQLLEDSTVTWFVADFDAGNDPNIVSAEALQQLEAFQNAGLHAYIERSRSGNGYHVWGFLDEPMPAAMVRTALVPLLVKGTSYDRLYPVQTAVSPSLPYGNLIALPFFGAAAPEGWTSKFGAGVPGGASVFLEDDKLEPVDPLAFMQSVKLNNRHVMEALAENAPSTQETASGAEPGTYEYTSVAFGETNPQGRPEKPLNGVIKLMSDFGCQFMAHALLNNKTISEPVWYAAIQQLTCFERGREAAHLISRDYPGYTPAETDHKYTHALRNPPVGCRYIKEHFPELACKGCSSRAPYHRINNQRISDLVQETAQPMVKSDYSRSIERMRRRNRGGEQVGTTWGIAGLDGYTRLRPKELTVIGAFPSIGKTALMIDAAVSLAERGVPVLLFSAETGEEGLEERLLARVSGVDSRAIRGERFYNGLPHPLDEVEERLVLEAAERLARLPIFTHYTATQPDMILDLIEDTLLGQGLSLNQPFVPMFDYLQFGSLDAQNGVSEYEKLSHLSKEFKYIAKILRQPFVMFSQLKREKEKQDGNDESNPAINWFKGTGRIESDADVAMILTGERTPGAVSKRKLWIVKQREGEAGVSTDLLLHQAICRFEVAATTSLKDLPKDIFAMEPNALVD
jgi:replicative DNA helicase